MAVETDIQVRQATPDDHLAVMNVIDGSMLSLDANTVERRIDTGNVLVAEEHRRVLGTLVSIPRQEGVHVEAIAVRKRRRDQGIGSALVEDALDRWGRLTAECDPEVRRFYETLGFDIEDLGERYRAELK